MTILSESNDFFIRFPVAERSDSTGYQWINPPDCHVASVCNPAGVVWREGIPSHGYPAGVTRG